MAVQLLSICVDKTNCVKPQNKLVKLHYSIAYSCSCVLSKSREVVQPCPLCPYSQSITLGHPRTFFDYSLTYRKEQNSITTRYLETFSISFDFLEVSTLVILVSLVELYPDV